MKNILIFSDGTCCEGGKGFNSNVYKLFNMVEDRTERQIAFYDAGLGTNWQKLTGSAGGMGISQNIIQCYEFLLDNYLAGDKIFLFGFSRGATTVRSLSGFIHLFGILPKSRKDLIMQAYNIYKISNREKRERNAKEFIAKHHTMWVKIKFIGVWDTVVALGLPFKSVNALVNMIPFLKSDFHDLTLSSSVENAFHAVAIDERRKTFAPTLWEPNLRQGQTMEQVWFPGTHTDIGGGYKESGLSDVTLSWMVGKAKKYGLIIFPWHRVKIEMDVNGLMHDSREGAGRMFREKGRTWDLKKYGAPALHESVGLRKNYRPWILNIYRM